MSSDGLVTNSIGQIQAGDPAAALRTIALCKLEGDTNDAIAGKLGCVRATVQRKLGRIRDIWAKEVGP